MRSVADSTTLAAVEDLAALREGVVRVLESMCSSAAVHAFIDGKSQLDAALWSRAAELGWLAIALPEEAGGLGLGAQGLDVLHRELGRYVAPGPFISTLVGAQWLLEATECLAAQYLSRIVAGELTIALPALIAAAPMLELQEDRVDGQIEMIGEPTAGIAIAPVGARSDLIGWAIVHCDGSSATLSRLEVWDLTRQACRLTCSSAPAIVIRDPDGSKGRVLSRHLSLAVAGDSLGAAAGIVDKTIDYLKTRTQFDKPIGSFQALKHRAADLVTLLTKNGHLLDVAVEATAHAHVEMDMWVALAKAGVTDACAFIAGDCIQLFGGVGHTWEFDNHIHAKRVRLNQALGASNGDQLDRAAAALESATRAGRVTTEFGR